MNIKSVWRLLSLAVLTVALSSQGLAQGQRDLQFSGLINDYTADFDGGGAWHIVGEWSASVAGESGRGSLSVGFTMVRADGTTRSFHTHHVEVRDAAVAVLSNGYRLSGSAVITGNGNFAGFTGSRVQLDITGGNALPFSNLAMSFQDAAINHFGSGTIKGVVTR